MLTLFQSLESIEGRLYSMLSRRKWPEITLKKTPESPNGFEHVINN